MKTWDDYNEYGNYIGVEDQENRELIEKLVKIATRHLKDKEEH